MTRWGVTAALTNVSDSVWGSFGYQGAAGVHSVVFRSWAHWPPERRQNRHNELLMTLWVTGRERASAHTQHNREPTQEPHVWCPCAYTHWHAHKNNTQSHIQMFSDKKWSRRGVLGEANQQAACIYVFVILMSFCMILTWANTILN